MDPDILLVDDDTVLREVMASILTREGYAVEEAGDGLEALDCLSQMVMPKLILLDLSMPRMTGQELRQILLEDPARSQIPVVVVTADATATRHHEWLRVQGWLLKPVKYERLLGMVRHYCPSPPPPSDLLS
jgi:adenylate cyclase